MRKVVVIKNETKTEAIQIITKAVNKTQEERYGHNFDELIFDTFFYEISNIDTSRIKTDNFGDGGVDYLFFTDNNRLVLSEEDIESITNDSEINIHFVQIKESSRLDSAVPNRLLELVENFFNNTNLEHYNEEIIDNVNLFNGISEKILPKGIFNVYFYYFGKFGKSALASTEDIYSRFKTLCNRVKEYDFIKNADFKIYTISDIYNALSTVREFEYTFSKIEKYTAEVNDESEKTEALISIIPINQCYNFIIHENGEINTRLFESNIRDYKGKSSVNKEIISTLEDGNSLQFWWLNNGITIIAEEINESSSAKKIFIKNPQIVNGLQTSYSIYNYFIENPDKLEKEKRGVFIKMIRIDPEHEGLELDITKATNRQNEIRDKDLRANEEVQKNIELYFKSKGKYYQRKDKYYTNRKYPKKDIVTLFDLAKYVYTIMFKDPVYTRNKTGKLLKDDKYSSIFKIKDPFQDYEIYYHCYMIYDIINSYNKGEITFIKDPFKKENFIHHIVYICVSLILGSEEYDPYEIKTIKEEYITEELTNKAYSILKDCLINNSVPESQVLKNIKSKNFNTILKNEIKNNFS